MRKSHPDFPYIRGPFSEIARPTCWACYRPRTHCVCRVIEPFEAHCNIVVLQHPNERRKYHSTAKLVSGAIKNSRVLHGVEFTPGELEKALTTPKVYMLYPSPGATDCSECVLDSDTSVIVVDGTWDEAGKIVYRNPILKTLPCLTFSQPLRSRYRIRKQPKLNYLSTIESVAHLLKINAAAIGNVDKCLEYDRLLEGFDAVIDRQVKYIPEERTI